MRLHQEHGLSHRDQDLRRSLERQRGDVLRAMRERIHNASEMPAERPHIEGAMLSDVVDDLDLALVSLQTETLEKIDDALGRLAAGEYGSCEDCGVEIPTRRLEALPFAVRCRACEEDEERRHWPGPGIPVVHHQPPCLS